MCGSVVYSLPSAYVHWGDVVLSNMRGSLVSLLGVVFLTGLSFMMVFSSNIFMMWLLMELGAIRLVCCFFWVWSDGVYLSLFTYVLVSCFSSSLIAAGFLFEGCFLLVCVGFLLKFGVFPFSRWVYSVFFGSK